LLLLLLVLLLWVLVFDMCNFRGHSLIVKFIQGIKSASGRCHRSNFISERVAEACPGNIVEDFIVLLKIPLSLSPISFQTIRIGSDPFLLKVSLSLHRRDRCHTSSVCIPINLGNLL
jgi:hypothetical protein